MFNTSVNIFSAGRPSGWWRKPVFQAQDMADSSLKGAAAIMDFRKNRHALTRLPTASIAAATASDLARLRSAQFSEMFAFTRSGTATYLDANGMLQTAAPDAPRFDFTNGIRQLLLEGAATNLFLNSNAGVTQDITVTAQSYTLSMRGTGSIALSGAATGTLPGTGANNRVSLTVTATAGTLNLAVSGSVTTVQLEAGLGATSYIPTIGSAVTRTADTCRFSPQMEALMQRSDVSVVVKGRGFRNLATTGSSAPIIGGATTNRLLGYSASGSNLILGHSSAYTIASGIVQPTASTGIAFALTAALRRASADGSASGGLSTPVDTSLAKVFLGRTETVANFAGWFDQLMIYPFRMTDASLQAKAVAYA
jgi:hypothetical protein